MEFGPFFIHTNLLLEHSKFEFNMPFIGCFFFVCLSTSLIARSLMFIFMNTLLPHTHTRTRTFELAAELNEIMKNSKRNRRIICKFVSLIAESFVVNFKGISRRWNQSNQTFKWAITLVRTTRIMMNSCFFFSSNTNGLLNSYARDMFFFLNSNVLISIIFRRLNRAIGLENS